MDKSGGVESGESDRLPLKMKNAEDRKPLRSMEDLLVAAGTHGWKNFLIFFCCAWGSFIFPTHFLSYQFLGATPEYWCHIPELIDANWTQKQIMSLSVPISYSPNEIKSCEMYDYNYTLAAQLGFDESIRYFKMEENNSRTIFCERRQFDENEPLTIVSKWDLVCDRRVIYSTTQSSVHIGNLIGFLIMGYLADLLGRRKVFVWSGPLYLFIGLVTVLSPNVTIYIILKLVISALPMTFYIAGLTLIFELCSTSQRSYLGSLFAIPWALGYMTLPGIAYYVRSFSNLQIASTLLVVTLFPHFWIIPESPRWLVLKGKFEEAIEVLKSISASNKTQLPPEKEMLDLMKRIFKEKQNGKRSPSRRISGTKFIFYKLFRLWVMEGWRWKLPILFFAWFSVSLVYFGVSLTPPDLRTGKYLYTFFGGLLEVLASILLWPANRYIGRKRSLVVLFFICSIAIFGAMGLGIINIKDAEGEFSPVKYRWLLALFLISKFATTAAFHMIWMYSVEFLPTEFRTVVVGEANVFARFGGILSPYIIYLLAETQAWASSAIFGSFSLMAGILFIVLPETKNATLAESGQEEVNEREGQIEILDVKA